MIFRQQFSQKKLTDDQLDITVEHLMSRCGDFLDQLKDEKGLKQRAFAARLKVTPSHLSYILSGKMPDRKANRQIALKTLRAIMNGLDPEHRPEFLRLYLEDILDEEFHPSIPGNAGSGRLREDSPTPETPAMRELITKIKSFKSPNRIAKSLNQLLKKANGRPDFLAAIEKIISIT